MVLGCHHWDVSQWSCAKLCYFFDAVNRKQKLLFLKFRQAGFFKRLNYFFETASSRGEFHHTCDNTQPPSERMTGKHHSSFQTCTKQTKARHICTSQVYNLLKIHARLVPTCTPTLLALFGVRCGVMQQPPDLVIHAGQHTCVSLSLGLSRPDVQVRARSGNHQAPFTVSPNLLTNTSLSKLFTFQSVCSALGDFPEKNC